MKKCLNCGNVLSGELNKCPKCGGIDFEIFVNDELKFSEIQNDEGKGKKPYPIVYEQSERLKEIRKIKKPSFSKICKYSRYYVNNFIDIYKSNNHKEEILRIFDKKNDIYYELIIDLDDGKIKINKKEKLSEKNVNWKYKY